MSILLSKKSSVVVQGITGGMGSTHTELMLAYGTNIIGGVTPNKGGGKVHGVPVFNTIAELTARENVDVSVIFVPPLLCKDAVDEAINAKIPLIVIITEGIPPQDEVKIQAKAKINGINVIGPNCPGIITPSESLVGIHPGSVYQKGRIGMVSRSGTLTYEIALGLSNAGLGQSTCVGIGGDPVPGLGFIEVLRLFEKDPETDIICLMGEIGGTAEESAAEIIEKGEISKPVIAYIAGREAPEGKRMGHAGAITSGDKGTAESKEKAFKKAGVSVAKTPSEMVELAKKYK